MAGVAGGRGFHRELVAPSYSAVADAGRLRAGWHRVWRNNGSFGGDGQTVAEFGERADVELEQLRAELLARRYTPRPLRGCKIPKLDGSERRLLIPSVRDRVVQQSALQLVSPWLDARFETTSWAYRSGRSHLGAVAALKAAWRAGYRWIAESDIDDFFGSIDRARLAGLLDETIHDGELVDLLVRWVGGRSGRGIPQGAPVSPVLSNLYLDRFDEEMAGPSRRLVRFADDFVVATRSADDAGRALVSARRTLSSLDLRLKPSKTALRAPADAVCFLGFETQDGEPRPARRDRGKPTRRMAPRRKGDGWHVEFDESERRRFRRGQGSVASLGRRTASSFPFVSDAGGDAPVSALRDLLVCPRAAWRTLCLADRTDTPAMRRGVEEHRAVIDRARGSTELAVRSRRLGLRGRIDLVERDGATQVVVELKSGPARRPSLADQVQLVAYGLCLGEMSGTPPRLELAFTESGRREIVHPTARLVSRVEALVRELHEIDRGHWVPTDRRRSECGRCRFRGPCRQER